MSGRSRDSRNEPFIFPLTSPFEDPRAPSRAGSDDSEIHAQTVSEEYNITPSVGLLLFPEHVEEDGWSHDPDHDEPDQEARYVWTKGGIVNVGDLALITAGNLR